jgi:hypothetical protein
MHKSPRVCRKKSAPEPETAPPLPRIAYPGLKSNSFFGAAAVSRLRRSRAAPKKKRLDFAAQYATISLDTICLRGAFSSRDSGGKNNYMPHCCSFQGMIADMSAAEDKKYEKSNSGGCRRPAAGLCRSCSGGGKRG